VVIHNHVELLGDTSYVRAPLYKKHPEKAPIHIQFHGNPVRFRNIWLRENVIPLKGSKPTQAKETTETPDKSTKAGEEEANAK